METEICIDHQLLLKHTVSQKYIYEKERKNTCQDVISQKSIQRNFSLAPVYFYDVMISF